MSLPHFNPALSPYEPIHKNQYEVTFIEGTKSIYLDVEKFNISNDIISFTIQDSTEFGYSNIKNSNLALIDTTDKKGFIIKLEIFNLEFISYNSEFSWESTNDLSIISASFRIKNSKLIETNELNTNNRKDLVNSFLRDVKLDDILKK